MRGDGGVPSGGHGQNDAAAARLVRRRAATLALVLGRTGHCRVASDQIAQFGNSAVPTDLPVWSGVETFFTPGDPSPVYAQQSAAVRLVYFDAGHDMIYNAAARWFGSDPGRSRTTVRTKDIAGSHRH